LDSEVAKHFVMVLLRDSTTGTQACGALALTDGIGDRKVLDLSKIYFVYLADGEGDNARAVEHFQWFKQLLPSGMSSCANKSFPRHTEILSTDSLQEAWVTDAMRAVAPKIKRKIRKAIPSRYMAPAMFKAAKERADRGANA
jgi:hypothetical protein